MHKYTALSFFQTEEHKEKDFGSFASYVSYVLMSKKNRPDACNLFIGNCV